MASNVFVGQVQGISKIATGTPSAFCNTVTGGSMSFEFNNQTIVGIGGQVLVRKGTTYARLDVECIGVALADIAKFFPTTAGVQVVSFPSFLVEVDDGTNGQEWLLASGQPATISVDLAEDDSAVLSYRMSMIFASITQQARGTKACVYNALGGHTKNEIAVAYGGSTFGTLGLSLTNDLGAAFQNPADGKSVGSKTVPEGCYVTKNAPRLSVVTSNVFKGGVAGILGDTWTAENITITCANGTAGENITYTLSNMVPMTWNMPVEAEGRIGFKSEFEPGTGTTYNRVALT